jgi:peptidoglycan/LPS O-acetylase OafA/YrhL
VGLSFWVQLVLAGIVGILALVDASARQGTTAASIAFLVFLAAIAYGFYLIKRAFDGIDHQRNRDGN